jgi:hypothetical protein
MGLDVWFDSESGKAPVSKINPDHLFKVDYWRSSYNASGFNSIVHNFLGEDLYTIAGITWEDADNWVEDPEHEDGGYSVPPTIDWEMCRQNALQVAEFLKDVEPFGITHIRSRNLRPDVESINDEAQALKFFRGELQKYRERSGKSEDFLPFGSYSNFIGNFWLDEPLCIRAAISGKGVLGDEGLFIIYDMDPKVLQTYVESALIVAETAEWALEVGDVVSHWSR